MASSRLTGIAPAFLVDNVERTAEWYRDHLGFTINEYIRDDHGHHDESDRNHPTLGEAVFEILERDGQRLMLSRSGEPGSSPRSNRSSGTMDVYLWCEGVESLFQSGEILRRGDVRSRARRAALRAHRIRAERLRWPPRRRGRTTSKLRRATTAAVARYAVRQLTGAAHVVSRKSGHRRARRISAHALHRRRDDPRDARPGGTRAIADAGLELGDVDGADRRASRKRLSWRRRRWSNTSGCGPSSQKWWTLAGRPVRVWPAGGHGDHLRAVRDGGLPDRRAAREALHLGAEADGTAGCTGRRTDRTPYAEFEEPYGAIGANFGYAMIAKRYMHEHALTPEQLAKIAVAQRYNACHNPNALFFGQPITVEDVLNSPMVVDPLHLLEIVMPVAGAAALVVTSARKAKKAKQPPVYILGAGEHTTHRSITYAPEPDRHRDQGRRRRRIQDGGRAPQGHRPRQHLRLLHDHGAGFARRRRFLRRRARAARSSRSTTSSATAISRSTRTAASSRSARPARRRHVARHRSGSPAHGPGDGRQVKKPKLAFVNGNGGIMSEQVSLILGRDN